MHQKNCNCNLVNISKPCIFRADCSASRIPHVNTNYIQNIQSYAGSNAIRHILTKYSGSFITLHFAQCSLPSRRRRHRSEARSGRRLPQTRHRQWRNGRRRTLHDLRKLHCRHRLGGLGRQRSRLLFQGRPWRRAASPWKYKAMCSYECWRLPIQLKNEQAHGKNSTFWILGFHQHNKSQHHTSSPTQP